MKAREWLQNVGLSAGTLVLLAGGAEGVCRILERRDARRPMGRYITPWAAWDGDFYTVKSAAVGWPPWEDYNSDGLRDREHAVSKPAGVRRLICLGDSTTLGWNIQPEEAYPQVLQDQLSALGRDVEVFNVALGGWASRQELIAYRRIARRYQPDQVLVGVCLNDIPEMQNNLVQPPELLAGIHRRSALVRRLVRAQDREIREIEDVVLRSDAPEVRSGLKKVFADLKTLHHEVEADGARLAILLFPASFQIAATAPRPVPQERIAAFCAAEGIPCLDLLPAFRKAGEAAFIDHVHFSPSGARLVAEQVLESELIDDETRAPAGLTAAMARATSLPANSPRKAEALVAALRGADEAQRIAAARALGTLRAKEAVRPLVSALSDPSAEVRAAAAWALGGAGGSPDALAALTRGVADPSPRVRAGAAWALGRMGAEARPASTALVPLIDDADESVRWRAGDALAAIGPEPHDVLAPLLTVLQDRQAVGRGASAEIVGRMGTAGEPALTALIDALQDPRETVRWRAAWALGQIGPAAHDAVPALVKEMADARVRGHVADALGRIGPGARAAVPVLAEALKDESGNTRWRAAEALGKLGPAANAAATALLEALADSQENVRLAALRAAAAVGADPRVSAPAYVRCLADPGSRVRRESARTLARLGPEARRGIGALAQALSDDDDGVREEAAHALGRIGSLPPSAIQALTRALADRSDTVRFEATRALKKLRTQ